MINNYRKYFFILLLISLNFFLLGENAMAKEIEYSVSLRSDGGYTLLITCSKRHWNPITAEGFFPKEKEIYKIELIGEGEDWSYRNQNGYYYSLQKIISNKNHWDLGYVWVDLNRKFLYINLFWISSPNKLIESDINGKYILRE